MKHLDTQRLYPSEELAKKALRRGKWTERPGGWSRKTKGDSVSKVATIVLFEGMWKISIESISKSDFLSWS